MRVTVGDGQFTVELSEYMKAVKFQKQDEGGRQIKAPADRPSLVVREWDDPKWRAVVQRDAQQAQVQKLTRLK